MASASIESTVVAPVPKITVTDASRDDLELNDEVVVNSVNNGVAYTWSLAYSPEGSSAAFSGSEFDQTPGSFTVDQDGPYLIRLVLFVPTVTVVSTLPAGSTLTLNGVVLTSVNGARTPGANDFDGSLGTATAIAAEMVLALNDGANSFSGFITPTVAVGSASVNLCPVVSGTAITAVSSTALMVGDPSAASEQFVRLRALTAFGSLKLVSAGERVGTVPVPVDITITGWADEQNFNLLSLLGFVSATSSSGRVLYVDLLDGDYNTIQAAMDYAQSQSPLVTSQWVVLVRPGLYVEDLTFYPFVHLFGWPGGQSTTLVQVRNATTASHTVALPLTTDQVVVSNLYFDQVEDTANPALLVSGAGTFTSHKSSIVAAGVNSPQGAGLRVSGSALYNAFDCRFSGSSASSAGSVALAVYTGASAVLRNCRILVRGVGLQEASSCFLRDCELLVSGTYGVVSRATDLTLEYCQISGSFSESIAINPSGAGSAGAVSLAVRWSRVEDISFRTAAIVGASTFLIGATEHGALTFPDGSPSALAASTPSDTIFYDNSTTGIAAENVQDALDEIYTFAAAVRTLDDAYDGGDPGPTGSGRVIVADAGAVQIVDAAAPSDPIPPGNSNGGLDVVGRIHVGAIGKPEISLDPNPFGNGPSLLLGREIWAPDAPFGSTSVLLGDSTGAPGFRNYNLTVGTKSALAGTQVGRVLIRGGDSLNAAVDASNVYVQAGRGAAGGGGDGGDLFLVAGDSVGGADGRMFLVRAQDGTPATLTASGAFVGGVAGPIRFSTDMGAIEVDILVGDLLAAVLAKFDATGFVTALDSGGGVIELTAASTGLTSEVFFLNSSAGVDAALGGFASQPMVPGTWPTRIDVEVSASGEVTFGSSFANPMIYNAVTGKLTVPGLIDPTGLILDTNTALNPGGGKGVIFVGDGTSGTVLGDFYFRWEGGALQNISAVVVGATGVTIEDEGVAIAGNPHTILDFVGAGVTATDAGAGRTTITIASGGGNGIVSGVQQDSFAASAFTSGAPGAFISLTQTYDTAALLVGMVLCYENGAADMSNVGAAVPTTSKEYRISGNDLQIGADITGTSNSYRIVYPRT